MESFFSAARKSRCQTADQTGSAAENRDRSADTGWRFRLRRYASKVLASNDDPHFIAMGVAAGVFVGCTPTIPFHTILAVALAFALQGSKAAAALGVWVCNPFTLPFLYVGSYTIGDWLLGASLPFQYKYEWIPELLKIGIDKTLVMVTGGVVLGVIPGVAAYFISRWVAAAIIKKRRSARRKRRLHPACPENPGHLSR